MEETIFTKEELSRIKTDVAEHPNEIVVDVHGMCTRDAWRFIHNIAVLRRHQSRHFRQDGFTITVIHGYLGGISIKKAIWEKPISARVQSMKSCSWNPGVTSIQVA